uniref:glutamyl-tRNA reductase-binding protein, chloroplastic n=1 Tax=Erigeron canadensis TaxID=72917 RepID=UPI001CB92FFB|nr:glutamyl-tRNA reductase-binding protein, chloroplastic [Erigeron canadensis]
MMMMTMSSSSSSIMLAATATATSSIIPAPHFHCWKVGGGGWNKKPPQNIHSKSKERNTRCWVTTETTTTIQFEEEEESTKPTAGEVSRTIMELSSIGSFHHHSDKEDVAVAVRFAVEPQKGTPILSLSSPFFFSPDDDTPLLTPTNLSALNVQLDQCGLRTTQCTIQGSLHTPPHHQIPFFQSLWEKKFGEKAQPQFIHILDVQRVLHINNFVDDAVWVSSSDYQLSNPDPLRDVAQRLVHEINTHNMEDLLRFCNIYVHSHVEVSHAKMVWVDRLGLDIHLYSPQNDVFEVRIPFPREVTNEKGARSSFNGMAQLAWEVEKNYHPLEFEKVKHLNKIASKI